jgi:hypothetical protein
MGGNVFECYEEQTDRRQYAKTVEALEGHVKKSMKYPEDLAPLFATDCKLPVLQKPPRPAKVGDKEPDEADWRYGRKICAICRNARESSAEICLPFTL